MSPLFYPDDSLETTTLPIEALSKLIPGLKTRREQLYFPQIPRIDAMRICLSHQDQDIRSLLHYKDLLLSFIKSLPEPIAPQKP
jgi:hypothetical protein